MDIDGLGGARCRELLARELILQPADIYFLTADDWQQLARTGPARQPALWHRWRPAKTVPWKRCYTPWVSTVWGGR